MCTWCNEKSLIVDHCKVTLSFVTAVAGTERTITSRLLYKCLVIINLPNFINFMCTGFVKGNPILADYDFSLTFIYPVDIIT